MSDHDIRPTSPAAGLPSPRAAADDTILWPEPWFFSRPTRPRSDYWAAESATWRSSAAVPSPRSGD